MNLLNYVSGDSFLHRLNPVTKLLSAFMYGIAAIICNNVIAEILFIVLMILISGAAGIARRALFLTRNLFFLGLLMFVIQLFFVRTGEPVCVIGGFVLFTMGGLKSALLLSFRVIAAMLPLMLLFAVTRMNDLCNALVKRVHLPYKYAFIVTTAFRFVPIFATEFHDIQDAQKSRGVDFDTKNIFRKLRLIAPLCVPLLISSLKKVDVSAMSAEMRGFELRGYKSGYKEYPFGIGDLVTFIILLGLIVFSALFLR